MTTNDLAQAAKLLNDPLWRLNNLYWIIDKSGNKSLLNLKVRQKIRLDKLKRVLLDSPA